ncbi:MAG: InlB B-repeat-containing protein [Gemmiger sp.]
MNESSEMQTPETNPAPGKKRWFGRGIYGSKDVPIRVLDACIAVMIAVTVLLTVYHSVNGGFAVEFDGNGADTAVETQSIRYGSTVAEPDTPVRPGYDFVCWSTDGAAANPWDFGADTVTGDMKLFAVWQPAQITVKFDLAGGTVDGSATAGPITVTYGGSYGALPVPEKEGAQFAGWEYSGQTITADSAVASTGEHVLTARWK